MSESPDISLTMHTDASLRTDRDPELVRLLEDCKSHDRSAQETLYKRYYGKMMGLCMRYVKNKDDAMEILNHGFLKVFRSLDQYNFNGPFEAWIHRIVYNSIIDSLRSKTRMPVTEEINDHQIEYAIDAGVINNLFAGDLMKMLDLLPEATRIVFNMFAIEGYKHEEIAGMLNISAGTSKWHVSNARATLKNIIETHYKS